MKHINSIAVNGMRKTVTSGWRKCQASGQSSGTTE